MDQFLDFLREYWFQLGTGLFALIEIILIIVKRKPKSIDDFNYALNEVLALIPDLVIKIERPGNGAHKKDFVITSCLKLISNFLSRSLTSKEVSYVKKIVSNQIETVLTTPTKKEGNVNAK